ncbi:MAG: GNAT family N-acetyltransferase, partial [bacterium]
MMVRGKNQVETFLPTETIVTERLWIIPLSGEELGWYVGDAQSLAERFRLKIGESPAPFFQAIVGRQCQKVFADPGHWLWLTFWLIVDRETHRIVGSIDYKNIPDDTGTVEIGYGIDKCQENKGYATAAVQAFTANAFTKAAITRVI